MAATAYYILDIMGRGKKESKKEEVSDNESSDHNITIQYGIFVDIEHDSAVDKFLTKKYPKIIDDYKLNKRSTIIRSYNGDDEATQVGIVVSEMAVDGPNFDGPGAATMFDPAKLIEFEDDHRPAMEFLSDLHEALVKEFAAKKLPHRDVLLGWNAAEAVWD